MNPDARSSFPDQPGHDLTGGFMAFAHEVEVIGKRAVNEVPGQTSGSGKGRIHGGKWGCGQQKVRSADPVWNDSG